MKKIIVGVFVMLVGLVQAQPSKDFEMEILLQCTPVQDQQMSGTCWSFASTSFVESELLRMQKGRVNLSEMFLARKSYLLKIEQYLANKGQTFFTAGGQPHDVLKVMKQEGIMPEEAYKGTTLYNTHYHAPLDSLMIGYARASLKNDKSSLNESDKAFVNTILNVFLGEMPEKFMYQSKSYTAQTFMKEVLDFNPDDYISIVSTTEQPFYKPFVLQDKYNWAKEMYYNVPLEDFTAITQHALQKGFTVIWDGDSVEPTFEAEKGMAFMPEGTVVSSESRQKAIDKKETQIEHVMHIVGLARQADKNATTHKKKASRRQKKKYWYYVKNSWGEISEYKGFLYMSEDFFKMKTMAITLHKEAIPANVLKKIK